ARLLPADLERRPMKLMCRALLLPAFLALPLFAQTDSPQAKPEAKPARLDLQGDPLPPHTLLRLGTVRLRHGNHVSSVAFAAGDKIVSAGGDHTIRIWDQKTGRELRHIEVERENNNNFVVHVSVSPDGKTLALPFNGELRFWEMETGKELPK